MTPKQSAYTRSFDHSKYQRIDRDGPSPEAFPVRCCIRFIAQVPGKSGFPARNRSCHGGNMLHVRGTRSLRCRLWRLGTVRARSPEASGAKQPKGVYPKAQLNLHIEARSHRSSTTSYRPSFAIGRDRQLFTKLKTV